MHYGVTQFATISHTQRGLLLAAGLLLGIGLAIGTAGLSWQATAIGLGFALAVLAGIVQRCSA